MQTGQARELHELLQQTLSECVPFCRDTRLAPEVLEMYREGSIFREPTFCDASCKIAGLAAPHRYLILSANARCLDDVSQHPEWGLCIWQTGRCFKVIDRFEQSGFTQITLLEIPEPLVPVFASDALAVVERDLAQQARKLFEAVLKQPALPELSTRLWLDRLEHPLGINDAGNFFELLSHPTGDWKDRPWQSSRTLPAS